MRAGLLCIVNAAPVRDLAYADVASVYNIAYKDAALSMYHKNHIK